MKTFSEFIRLREENTVGYHNDGPGSGFAPGGGAILGSDFTGSETAAKFLGNPLHLPSMDMEVRKVERTSPISSIDRHSNPIKIQLLDGTKLYMTWDQFKRVEGKEPAYGRLMHVSFQRHPDTDSYENSTVVSAKCL